MPKMTMREELEMLRKEVEELKRQQEGGDEKGQLPAEDTETPISHGLELAGEKVGEITDEMKEQLEELAGMLKKEYEQLSPVAAVLLFALGAVFGRAISSK